MLWERRKRGADLQAVWGDPGYLPHGADEGEAGDGERRDGLAWELVGEDALHPHEVGGAAAGLWDVDQGLRVRHAAPEFLRR